MTATTRTYATLLCAALLASLAVLLYLASPAKADALGSCPPFFNLQMYYGVSSLPQDANGDGYICYRTWTTPTGGVLGAVTDDAVPTSVVFGVASDGSSIAVDASTGAVTGG